ncbi:hypothetical protein D1R32_gp258 [Tunisvirus fontaine2]|uniref:Uncharacterized protein n=1 Tax=Tunisvirus fontaine2 TaxID=1421067 RepID=V9SE09_9VIRU|nr:hypothetical protein D1R32_gp258 [Tunisvirus fontaine2]AHC54975.1 hypothetical protein TNS_ORF257 [Tunisvirus fontaine2]
MHRVCKPTRVSASELLDIAKENNKRIRALKEELFRADSEFCVFCMTYLFTDTPDDDCTMCESCAHCYCVSCSKTLGMYQEDGLAVEGSCLMCYLGISNDYACAGDGTMEPSGQKPKWLDDTSLFLTVPKWTEKQEFNKKKGRCAVCYLDVTTYYGKKRTTRRDGRVLCRLCSKQ